MSMTSDRTLPSLKQLPPVAHPTTLWSQDSKTVTLKVQLRGVQAISLRVTAKQVLFWVEHEQKRNVLLITCFGDLLPAKSTHSIYGDYVMIILEKQKPVKWPRLTASDEKFLYLKPELTFDSDDEDEDELTFEKIYKKIPSGVKPSDNIDYYDECLPPELVHGNDANESSDDEDIETLDMSDDSDACGEDDVLD